MWQGKVENERQLLLSHGQVIASLFSKEHSGDNDTFIQFGVFGGSMPEPKVPGVDDMVAKFLKAGKVSFD